MKDRYKYIAPFYSTLARLVFGTGLKEMKTCFATNLTEKKLLIIGGGDGGDYRSFQAELKGEYWELSDAMLGKAQKNLAQSKLSFHLGHFASDSAQQFDEIWLHFILDTLPDPELAVFLGEIKMRMKPTAKIYLADFFDAAKSVQRIIHGLMVGFFRVFTEHPRKDIPDYEQALQEAGFRKVEEVKRGRGWIRAQLWEIAVN